MHEFTSVLETDETLLWRGQPVPRKLFNSLDRDGSTKPSGRRFTSIELSKIPTMEMEERGDGTGSIHFGSPGPFLSDSQIPPQTIPKFEDVPHVQAVYRLAKDAHSAI